MKILLTNDDGYNAIGIVLLEEVLKEYGNVYVVAPQFAKSGASSSFSFHPLDIIKYDENHYALNGTPIDCVIFGLNGLNETFDLVVSGCNNGYNLSFDCIYSGTIGACFESLVMKVPTIAFSTQYQNFKNVKDEIKKALDFILKNDILNHRYMLNVNLASSGFLTSKGVKLTKQFIRDVKYECNYQVDGKVVLEREEILSEKTSVFDDIGAVNQGYISITPLQMTRYNESIFEELEKKLQI